MQDREPHSISDREWDEIVRMPAVREAWGLTAEQGAADFASLVYGAKFNFVSGSPGYVGDIYILQGDALTDVSPMLLRRDFNGELLVC